MEKTVQSSTNLEPLEMDLITFGELIKQLTGQDFENIYNEYSNEGDKENVKSDLE